MIRKRIPGPGGRFKPTPQESSPSNVGPLGQPATDPLLEALVVMVAVTMCGAFGFRMWRAYGPRSWKYRLNKRRRGASEPPAI